MRISAKTVFVNNLAATKRGWATKSENGLNEMANDVMRLSNSATPKLSGNLRSGRKKEVTSRTERRIVWDQPYASYQERGRRFNGSHVISRYTTAGTGKRYANSAAKKVSDKSRSYFK